MANFAGSLVTNQFLAVNLPGLSRGRIHMRPPKFAVDLIHDVNYVAGFRVAGPGRPAAPASSNFPAQVARPLTQGFDWFDHVHIIPRATIDFGNIITTIEVDYEIFNAFAVPISFISVVNNAGSGITLPNLPTPVVSLGAFNSFLDPTTVRGSLVKLKVRADPDGAPSFDSFIRFSFSPGNFVDLFVTGSRIALSTPEAETPVVEILRFGTSILELAGGKEQRISFRKQPRQAFEYSYILEGEERNAIQALFFGWQPQSFGIPLWHERLLLTATIGVGANVATVASTADTDLRVGGRAVLYKSRTVFDVLQILSLTATTVTFASNTANAYAVGDKLMPVRTARIEGSIQGTRYPVTAESFRVNFESVENDVGAPTPSAAGFSSFNGRVLLDGLNVLTGAALQEEFTQKLAIIDNEAGLIYQASDWTRNKRSFQIGFAPITRAALYALRQLLYFLRGKQTAFWAPTFISDLTVAATLTAATATMVINNIGYTKYVLLQHPKATFKITFTDGTFLVRTIIAAVETSTTIETLTVDANWTTTKTAAEVASVQFYELVRFDTDEFQFVHHGIGRARLFAPVKVVFDL